MRMAAVKRAGREKRAKLGKIFMVVED